MPPTVSAGPSAASLDMTEVDAELRRRTIVLVGLMGVGKTTVGRGLAQALQMPFRDVDEEIERAAAMPVADIFATRGEAEFRDGERRVIARLLTQEPPHVLSFGGGAFMHPKTRELVRRTAISVWLKTDLELLARRVARKSTRPLLIGRDPLEVLQTQAEARYPLYGEATLTVHTSDASSATAVATVLAALKAHLGAGRPSPSGPAAEAHAP